MDNYGVIYEIQNDKAIILTNDKKFIAIRKHHDMEVGKVVKFEKTDIVLPESKVFRYSSSSKRIDSFSKVTGVKNFSKVNNIKNFSRVSSKKGSTQETDIKNFSRVSSKKESSQEESNIKNFSRVSNKKDSTQKPGIKNFSRIINIRNFSRVAGIAAAFMIIFVFSRSVMLNNGSDIEYAYVSVDINPSVEVVIDDGYKVTEVTAMNEDAKEVLEGLVLEGKVLKTAVTEIIKKAESSGYITDDKENYVLISMVLNDESKEYNQDVKEEKLNELDENITQGVKELGNNNIVQKTVKLTSEERKEAIENDVSMGRYSLFLEAKEKGLEVTIGEVKTNEVSVIIKKLEETEVPTPVPTPVPTSVLNTPTPVIPTTTPSNTLYITLSPSALSELTEKDIAELDESVVIVTAYDKNKKIVSQGSGFCVESGLFVTNYHLVENAVSLAIITDNKKVFSVEGIVKLDKARDLVVLKTSGRPGISPLKLGSKLTLREEDKVVALDNSEGLKTSVSEGVVKEFGKAGSIDVIGITIPIKDANSCGPLFDMKGNVVGVTSYKFSKGNQNFAIPADYIANWVKELSRISFSNIKVIRKTLVLDDSYEMKLVVFNIVNALENEDADRYFNSMTKERYSDGLKNNLTILFNTYDLVYNLESIEVINVSTEKAEMSYIYSIYKEKGPEFKNCKITGRCMLKKVDGAWKINKSDETIEYID